MKRNWFEMKAGRANAPAEIFIYDEIGLFGISAMDFIAALKALGEPKAITVRINSPGGEVFAGIAIHNALARHPADKTVVIDGIAASIASFIAMAGDTIEMPDNAMMMLHNPGGLVLGTSNDMRDLADALDKMRESMVSAYAGKSKQPRDRVIAMMDAETWLTAAEAVELGFADSVTEPVKMAAKFDLTAKFGHVPTALQLTKHDIAVASWDRVIEAVNKRFGVAA